MKEVLRWAEVIYCLSCHRFTTSRTLCEWCESNHGMLCHVPADTDLSTGHAAL